MPSPFPGTDPYLEGSLWTSVHTQLSVEIARNLSPRLRPRYVVRTPKRFVISDPDVEEDVAVSTADVYPDVSVAVVAPPASPAPAGPAAAATAAPPLHLAISIPQRIPHVTVEIHDVASRQLVTAIKVLSPTNKRGDGRDEYVARRRRFLLSSAHLIQIDLLRRGRRVPMRRPLPAYPYFVILSRAERRPVADVWPIRLTDPLPTLPIPLLPGDADVPLDLQQMMSQVYDGFSYDLEIDYRRPPEVPLSGEDADWAEERLRAWRAPPADGAG